MRAGNQERNKERDQAIAGALGFGLYSARSDAIWGALSEWVTEKFASLWSWISSAFVSSARPPSVGPTRKTSYVSLKDELAREQQTKQTQQNRPASPTVVEPETDTYTEEDTTSPVVKKPPLTLGALEERLGFSEGGFHSLEGEGLNTRLKVDNFLKKTPSFARLFEACLREYDRIKNDVRFDTKAHSQKIQAIEDACRSSVTQIMLYLTPVQATQATQPTQEQNLESFQSLFTTVAKLLRKPLSMKRRGSRLDFFQSRSLTNFQREAKNIQSEPTAFAPSA